MRAVLLAGAVLVALAAGCSTYREPPPADIVPGRVERGDRVHILTKDGERFHAIVDSVEDGWVTVRDKEYRYQDGVQAEAQRARDRYALADLASILVQGPARLDRKAVLVGLIALSVLTWIMAPVYVE